MPCSRVTRSSCRKGISKMSDHRLHPFGTSDDALHPALAIDEPARGPAGRIGPAATAGDPSPNIPGYGPGSNVLGDTDVHLLDYVKVLYKRRWTALTAFLIVVVTVAVYTFTATPIYQAHVQILIEKEA